MLATGQDGKSEPFHKIGWVSNKRHELEVYFLLPFMAIKIDQNKLILNIY